MPILPNFLEGTAIGVLNDVVSAFHSNEGKADLSVRQTHLEPWQAEEREGFTTQTCYSS